MFRVDKTSPDGSFHTYTLYETRYAAECASRSTLSKVGWTISGVQEV